MQRMTTLVACWTILLARLERDDIGGLADYLSFLSRPSVPAEAALAAAH
jgi:hypothetical protein